MKLLTAAQLVDGAGDAPVSDGAVLIDGETIVYAGPRTAVPESGQRAEVIDLGSDTLLPGLIDCHSHPISFPTPTDVPSARSRSDHLALLHAVKNQWDALWSGITTIRDCGAPRETAFALRQAVEEGAVAGPRLLVAGRPICPTGGHGYKAGSEADGPWGVQREARKLFKEGADFLKLTATGGGTARTARHRATFTTEEIAAAVVEAEAHDSYATAHCHGIEGIVRCLDAGMPMIEHGTFVGRDGTVQFDPEIAKRMADQGTVVVPTVQIHGRWLEEVEDRVDAMDDAERALWQRRSSGFKRRVDLVGQLHEAGVEILMGSDAGMGRDYPAAMGDLGYGLVLHIGVGIPIMEAIKSATSTAASYLGIGDVTGSLVAGKQADVIAVSGDPFRDVSSLERTSFVMKAGSVIRAHDADPDG